MALLIVTAVRKLESNKIIFVFFEILLCKIVKFMLSHERLSLSVIQIAVCLVVRGDGQMEWISEDRNVPTFAEKQLIQYFEYCISRVKEFVDRPLL
jgi:hypothetical protein